ncbi:TMEM175 family protein [Zhouia spongiae]|uniref:TMEM175 family protein n=1 Tax=Zhouia spongiae TaxID=2202721 RepID=A0ABY3YKB9_9FLAO|nr:TMEM175 family protein [Zhouia spongiae]UNY98038.1 TMEM175 family protein [Zhouia spongiae]
MKSGRLEAFSDGVLAIVITIMVLEMKAPEDTSFEGLLTVLPTFTSYLLSFIYLGIYWNNHHHLMQATEKVNGAILWANLHLLFWLSLIPFATSWLGENHTASLPVALYGFILLMSAIAYRILEIALIKHHGKQHLLQKAINKGKKEIISTLSYVISIPLAFLNSWLSLACIVFVAILWIVPERNLENLLKEKTP